MQKLSEYRNKLAYKAVSAVFAYFCAQFDDDVNLKDDGPELAEFAKDLLSKPKHGFVFKGMENTLNVSRNYLFKFTLNPLSTANENWDLQAHTDLRNIICPLFNHNTRPATARNQNRWTAIKYCIGCGCGNYIYMYVYDFSSNIYLIDGTRASIVCEPNGWRTIGWKRKKEILCSEITQHKYWSAIGISLWIFGCRLEQGNNWIFEVYQGSWRCTNEEDHQWGKGDFYGQKTGDNW